MEGNIEKSKNDKESGVNKMVVGFKEDSINRYSADSIQERITDLPKNEKDILDQALNKIGLAIDLNFDFSSASDETLKNIASLLADLQFHKEKDVKQKIAVELASVMDNL